MATAAYGSPMEDEVVVLREFRDRYLMTNTSGRKFVALYYATSPPLANFIARHESMRTAARIGLIPIVKACRIALESPFGAMSLTTAAIACAAVFALLLRRKRQMITQR